MKVHNLKSTDFEQDEIINIEPMEEMELIDICVDDTHMFYANDIYTHNSSLEHDVIGAEKIAEAFSKMMVADFVMSLSRKIEDKVAGTGRFHVIKNRFGPDGITFPSKINTSTGNIQIYEDTSMTGREVKKQMDNSSETRRLLVKTKYNELMNDNLSAKKINGFESESNSDGDSSTTFSWKDEK